MNSLASTFSWWMVQVVPANPRIFVEIFDAVTKGVLDPKDRPDGKMFRLGPVVIENSRGKILHQGVSSEPEIIDLLGKMIELGNREDVPSLYAASICHFLFEYIHPSMTVTGERGGIFSR